MFTYTAVNYALGKPKGTATIHAHSDREAISIAEQVLPGHHPSAGRAMKTRVPDVLWNATFIPFGESRQRWHSDNVKAPSHDARAAAEAWFKIFKSSNTTYEYGETDGVIAVCERADVRDEHYRLATYHTQYFTLRDDEITPGITSA